METVIVIGRVLLAMIFLGSGIQGHLIQARDTAAYGESRGLKSAVVLVQISGILITAGAVGVMLGIWIDLAALGLAVYALLAAFLIHHFWTDEGDTQVSEMTNFMKNLSIAGAMLIVFAAAANGADLGATITDPLF